MEPQFSPAPPGFPRPFGAYLLLSPIAQGGMGDVFLASTRGVSGAVRLVVIKTLREDLAQEPGYVNRFLDEARIVIQLQHPNISQVFDVGIVDGTHFFAMEHILGTNLRRLTAILGRQGQKLPPALAMFVAAEVLDGLDCAHTYRHALTGEPLQVVHRDISPQNIMISLQGEVKIIDFGLAESTLKLEQTESRVVLGKIAYMSPEQARGDDVDARTDQYSAAVVLYELLTGERFYGDRGQHEIWAVAGQGSTPDRLGELDPELQALIRRGLAADKDSRFPSCGLFSAELRKLLAERNPEVDRGALRDFMRSSANTDVETSEKNVRALSQLALRTLPDLATPRAAGAGENDVRTGVTKTNLPAEGPAQPAARARPRTVVVAAAGGGVIAALGIALLFSLSRGDDTSPAAGVDAGVLVVPPAPQQEPPPRPVEVREPEPPPPEAEPAPPPPQTAKKPAPKPPARKAERPWVSWSTAKKVDALKSCKAPCAQLVQKLKGSVMPTVLESCLVTCKVK